MAGIVPRFSATPGSVRHTGPELGEHTRDVLRELAGLSDEQITTLAARGLVRESS
jgi:formyl-CoA transferase